MNYIKQKCILFLCLSIMGINTNAQVPVFNSYPSAEATIYLDFDGHYVSGTVWDGGTPIDCQPATMTTAQITEAFNRVAEDYRPFNVNITTDEAVYLAAPLEMRIRVIVTSTHDWFPGVGGVAFIGSFVWGDDTPAFVFSSALGNSPKMVGECCSHESGHALGLFHQSTYDIGNCDNPIDEYNGGIGSGLISWAPIMGNSYYKNLTRWHDGQTAYGCGSTQDNLNVIATQNGFTYRTDDYGGGFFTGGGMYSCAYDDNGNLPYPQQLPVNTVLTGIIGHPGDVDMFRIENKVDATNEHIVVRPRGYNGYESVIGANLDIKITVYDHQGIPIAVYDPPGTPDIDVLAPVNSCRYFIKIEGTGNAYSTSYGSLGGYELSVTGKRLGCSADQMCALIIPMPDPFTSQHALEERADRSSKPSLQNNVAVSNTAKINSPDRYSYMIFNMNGQLISKGQLTKGMNTINVGARVKGVYLIRYIGNNKQWTEKFVVQ